MKKLKTCFASILALAFAVPAQCCWTGRYLPADYYMYHVLDKEAQQPSDQANCKAWQALTGGAATVEDIRQVVYKYSLSQLENLLKTKDSQNSFARYIARHQDKETADFLVLAKTCELARAEMADPWYYPSKDDEVRTRLEDVITAAASYKGKRLEDRYILQAVRAMFSLGMFSSIDSLWQERGSSVKPGIIRDMTTGYVAGALYNTGRKDQALKQYLASNDLLSIRDLYPEYSSTADLLAFAASHCPDSPQIPSILQESIIRLEHEAKGWEYGELDSGTADRYLAASLKAAANSKTPGIWYYTAAYLTDLKGADADALLSKAEKAAKSDFIADAVRVMRIYLDAKTFTPGADYNSRLLSQLRWLDGKICANLDDKIKDLTASSWMLQQNFSYYWWNDMLRKILLGYVAPKMDNSDPVLALRLRNMADNRLLSLAGRRIVGDKSLSLKQYRHSPDIHNDFDWSNDFFLCLDTLDISSVVEYEQRAGRGASELERFLDDRGWIDHDYLREIIGTRYLRLRDYRQAALFLAKVPSKYELRTNVHPFFDRLPFEYGFIRAKAPAKGYKLAFAREMVSLQQKMKSSDPNVSGEAMVRFGIGLRSSFDFCWALTQYHQGAEDKWLTSEERRLALLDSELYIRRGLETIRDEEAAARAHASVFQFKTAAEHYPGTRAGQAVASQCDRLRDYKPKNWQVSGKK